MIPFIRIEARVPPPRHKPQRSGSLVIDIHRARFSNDSLPFNWSSQTVAVDPDLREWYPDSSENPLSFEMQRVVCAYAGFGQTKARSFSTVGRISEEEHSHISSEPLLVFRNSSELDEGSPIAAQKSLLVRIPSTHVVLDKPTLDGLQLWADDVSQWAERLGNGKTSGATTRADVSRTTSMLGSRYFAHRAGSGSSDTTSTFQRYGKPHGSEFVVKAIFDEGKFFWTITDHSN